MGTYSTYLSKKNLQIGGTEGGKEKDKKEIEGGGKGRLRTSFL
jgi:hypothetical protein